MPEVEAAHRPAAGADRQAAVGALARALGFLEAAQLPGGEFRVLTSLRRDMADDGIPDPSVFPTAMIAHCLSSTPEADAMRGRALDFLLAERDRHGLWRHWTRAHPYCRQLPPDLDDSACVSAALAQAGRAGGSDPALLLANRDRHGRFLTWIVPGARWRGRLHARAAWPQLAHLATLVMFFRKTSAAPSDVDAGVNANVLHYLGGFPGHAAVVGWLLDILRNAGEADADKWYENPFMLWYLFARALVPLSAEAPAAILARLDAHVPETSLDHALAIATRLACGAPVPPQAIAALLAAQAADGSWPRAAVYFGGRARRADGSLAPAHPDTPHWGSEEVTTGFAVEALARWLRTEP